MAIKNAQFITSAPELQFCPDTHLPEICFAGRSNVGKSSLINALTNRKSLAKTSNVPGKTRAMNYFLIDNSWHLVDLPGYGYAKVSKKEQKRWGEVLNQYLRNRKQLELVVLLIDVRHEPQQSDLEFMFWLGSHQIPFMLVLTKADKIGVTKQQAALARLRKIILDMNIEVPVQLASASNRNGMDELYSTLISFID